MWWWWFSYSVISDSYDPMDCSLPGSSVHGFLQARILKWVAMASSRGSSWPRDQTQVSCIAGRFLTGWATRKPSLPLYYTSRSGTLKVFLFLPSSVLVETFRTYSIYFCPFHFHCIPRFHWEKLVLLFYSTKYFVFLCTVSSIQGILNLPLVL